ncbi:ATP-dependent helicase HrpB [Singulisphaera acidiphila]|uniref:ATP-dependent helicase HrpB n=1 Tax=Singulisphaera acidiphila (strain ATCC BAA-1392 / DSM 18658 / VKM B-2454 / MOB10) TaxID=886293 RepID=L0DPH6_SINAD|nr:ATP-dependent helicase HrpB [Singulisphaera acidiphila]AGA30586.1 ATP-dependent helicase HrpB [Singulisphaera acidiphila DSM 18658]
MTPLPIDAHLAEIVSRTRERRSLVLVAPPGAGKTTRVPVALIKAGVLSPQHPALVLLQPRRVAARAAADRIAAENGWALGEEVGYQIRFERKYGPRTRIRVLTEGILNRRLIADPFLEGIGAVVLDEFHERSLHTDLALALLREIRDTVRDDLVIVVMSATMDAEPVARFLIDAPVMHVEGRTFPVEIVHRPTVRPSSAEAVLAAVEEALAAGGDPSDILVFLPGAEEIRRAGARLRPLAEREGLLVLPLHGGLSTEEQRRPLCPSERRKVVLATNIAETSLTIDGVRTVIDCGLARFASVDPQRGLDRLELGRISRASATQRAGRAGRTSPGRCLRLWSEREHRGLAEADLPEIHRVDLCGTALVLHAWGQADPRSFGWYDPPTEQRLNAAEDLLTWLGARDTSGRITPLGRQMLELPVHPRLGRLLIAAAHDGFVRQGAALAALLSEKDILSFQPGGTGPRVSGRGSSDLLVRLDLLAQAEHARFSPGLRDRGVDPGGARRVVQVRDDLIRTSRRLPGARESWNEEPDEDLMLRWVVLAYPDRVVRRRGSEVTGLMVGGRGVRLAPESVVRDAEFFVALDPREDRRGGTSEARVRLASALSVDWLEELFPDAVRRERLVRFDEERQRPVGVNTFSYRGLPLREDRNAPVDPAEASRALAEFLQPRAAAFFQEDEAAAAWLARLTFLTQALPDLDGPVIDDAVLAEILAEASAGKRSVDELKRGQLLPLLKGRLTYAQNQWLDEHAPEALVVPSGSRIRLTYEPGRPPVLAVRLQELFGWTETPRVARKRVAVLLHLLGPNYRPVQVTEDLSSFWATTYFQVRKDLRARYPKHSWPDDPLSARAEAKGSRRS